MNTQIAVVVISTGMVGLFSLAGIALNHWLRERRQRRERLLAIIEPVKATLHDLERIVFLACGADTRREIDAERATDALNRVVAAASRMQSALVAEFDRRTTLRIWDTIHGPLADYIATVRQHGWSKEQSQDGCLAVLAAAEKATRRW